MIITLFQTGNLHLTQRTNHKSVSFPLQISFKLSHTSWSQAGSSVQVLTCVDLTSAQNDEYYSDTLYKSTQDTSTITQTVRSDHVQIVCSLWMTFLF